MNGAVKQSIRELEAGELGNECIDIDREWKKLQEKSPEPDK